MTIETIEVIRMERPTKNNGYTSICELRESISRWLHIDPIDSELIDFIFSVYRSNKMPGDPVWGLIIDASGGGKTEMQLPKRAICPSMDYSVKKLTRGSDTR